MNQSDYYKARLDHTLKNTQQSTRLIYLVNGAALGLLYAVMRLQKFDYQLQAQVIVLGTLAFINLMHGCLILRQGKWYASIDAALAASLFAKRVDRGGGFPVLGMHDIYATIHFGLFVVLSATAGLIAYQAGWFPRLLTMAK